MRVVDILFRKAYNMGKVAHEGLWIKMRAYSWDGQIALQRGGRAINDDE